MHNREIKIPADRVSEQENIYGVLEEVKQKEAKYALGLHIFIPSNYIQFWTSLFMNIYHTPPPQV